MNENSLRNLQPAKKGEVRNPNGRPNTLNVKRINITIPASLLAEIDAKTNNRSEAIREALEAWLVRQD